MTRLVLLDTGPLGKAIHPRVDRNFAGWLRGLFAAGVQVRVPEIADYELRRELLLKNFAKSIERLDKFEVEVGYVPLSTGTMRKAAEFWAEARRRGYPTAHDKAVDADVILAAQALILTSGGDDVLVATEDVGDLQRFIKASHWKDIPISA